MKLIVKQLSYLLISFVFFTAMFGVSSKVFFSYPSRIDTNNVSQTLFNSESQLVMFHRNILWDKEQKMLIYGSSIARKGLRPELLESEKIKCEFHNLSLSASNITQMNQEVRMLLNEKEVSGMDGLIFLFGITFQSFVENKYRWKKDLTMFDLSKKQFFLFEGDANEFYPRLKPDNFILQKEMITPFLFIDKVCSLIALYPVKIRSRLVKVVSGGGWLGDNFFVKLNDRVMTQAQKDKAFLFWENYFKRDDGTVGEEQFEELKGMIKEIIERGCKIEIVNLPVPHWLSERMGQYKDYEVKINQLKNWLFGLENAGFIDLKDMNDDIDFYDSSHPKPDVILKWNNRLLQELKTRDYIKSQN
ncbi:MAG: hypothetical protein COA79_17150 [Planctomycetota bacterium]|nr:MAG: hypothetical protein COA79_17150 [Planctomycetota bacterium]